MDKIYTPPHLASLMAKASHTGPSISARFVVADFAAGTGELLLAAKAMWPAATVVANDTDPQAVRTLRKLSESWRIGACDFLNSRSRRNSSLLRSLLKGVDLVLLNPPFSSRGSTRVSATAGGVTSKCSVGLAFVVNSIDYLTDGGELVAVLPAGSLTSERDATTWSLLNSMGDTEVLRTNGLGTFPHNAVRTVVVRFQKRHCRANTQHPVVLSKPSATCLNQRPPVHIIRGTTMVNEVQESPEEHGSIAFLHSVHLQNFSISSHWRVGSRLGRCATGPMVLLPRVGQPKQSKVVKCLDHRRFVLSDCVIALACSSLEATELLWENLQSNWSLLEEEYVGSGARYITNRRLSDLLLRLGYFPLIVTSKGHRAQRGATKNA